MGATEPTGNTALIGNGTYDYEHEDDEEERARGERGARRMH